jgi:hypothetical protein
MLELQDASLSLKLLTLKLLTLPWKKKGICHLKRWKDFE